MADCLFCVGMFVGRRFFPPNQVEFNSGGAGYILDQVSLQVWALILIFNFLQSSFEPFFNFYLYLHHIKSHL